MSVCSDKWIRRMAVEKGMIEPFVDGQIKQNEDGNRVVSYGLSSYGYDLKFGMERAMRRVPTMGGKPIKGVRGLSSESKFCELIEKGASVTETQEILGHRSVATTSLYVHADRKKKRAAIERLFK